MLKDLIASIRAQDFPQSQIEILVITEGDSEQAKAIGIRRAKGEICAMFCADNMIMDKGLFKYVLNEMRDWVPLHKKDGFVEQLQAPGCFEERYAYVKEDNSLNRYFSLMGCNDPIAFYLGKCDRIPWYKHSSRSWFSRDLKPSYGDNGFFMRTDLLKKTNLEHYYPMDNAQEVLEKSNGLSFTVFPTASVWHRTSDNLISFLKKRYRYARDLYCERTDRRWKMLDTREDYWKLCLFVIYTLTIIQPLSVSIRGFRKVPDIAWAWHWPVCFGFLITYTILAIRNLFKHGRLFQCPQPA